MFILDQPTAPVVVNVVCITASVVVLWRLESNGESQQEFMYSIQEYHNHHRQCYPHPYLILV